MSSGAGAEPSGPRGPFRVVQVEVPWTLGPPEGRYVVRDPDAPDEVTHVVIVAALSDAPRSRTRSPRRSRPRDVDPEPGAAPVATGRATIVDVRESLADSPDGERWLRDAGEDELAEALVVLARALHAHRVVAADPYPAPASRERLIVARIGFASGEQAAHGRFEQVRELPPPSPSSPRGRRARLTPQARLAAVIGGRERPLVCEELVLRARADLDETRPRAAALQLLVALDAALAELPSDPAAAALAERIAELRTRREPVAHAAQAALTETPSAAEQATVADTVERLEAALRARAAARRD